jgi:pilus assembly protein Flp/PilA
MLKKLSAMMKDEKGQALAEYGLILALIAVVAVIALTALGTGISGTLGSITAQL